MTLPGKTHHNSHCSYSPNYGASIRRRAPVERPLYGNLAVLGNRNCVQILTQALACGASATLFRSGTRHASPHNQAQPPRDMRADRATRCAAGMPVQLRSLWRSGVPVSWVANQQQDGRFRQIAAGSNVSPKKSALWTGKFPSTTSQNSSGAKRRSSFFASGPDATRARRSAGSLGQVRRPAPRSTRFGPTSILVSIAEARHV